MDTINENLTTEARVMKAIEQIITRKEKVTNNAVKLELGGGSFSTISPFLKKWRESQRQTTTVITVPEKIREMIFHHGGLLYQNLKADSMEDYENLKSQYKADVSDLEGENAEQAMELSRLEEKLSEALKIREKQDEQVAGLLEDLQQISAQHAMEQTKHQSALELSREYKDNWQKSMVSEEKLRNDLTRQAALIGNHENTIHLLQQDYRQSQSQVESLTDDKNGMITKIEVLQFDSTALQKTLDDALREQKSSEQAAATIQKFCADQEATINSLQVTIKDMDALRQSLTKCQTELDGSKSRVRELVTETGGLKKENKELVKENASLHCRISLKFNEGGAR